MNCYRRLFTTGTLKPMTKLLSSNKLVQTKKLSSYSQEQIAKAEFAGLIYINGAMLAFPVLTLTGTMVGYDLVFKKWSNEQTHIGNSLTIIGGAILGALATPFYPIIMIIAPLKFIYELV